jgi:hypothetical protein
MPEESAPVVQADDYIIFQEEASALNRENLGKYIEYMFSRREQSSHFNSLLMRKVIIHYVLLHDKNIKHTARLINSIAIAAGCRELESVLHERWISNIKYYNRTSSKVQDIDLEGVVSHFLENGNINCKLQSPAHRTRMGNPGGMKPVWRQLELQFAD